MSWHFSRALVEEFSQATCSDGELSALSKSTHTHEAFCSHGRTTEPSRPSRSGMTSEPLTDGLGAELLKWCRADSLVRMSRESEPATAWTASAAAYGSKWPESLARFDRDSCSWKTRQLSLFADSGPSLEVWPPWGMSADGECWALTMLAGHIDGNEFGLWARDHARMTGRPIAVLSAPTTPMTWGCIWSKTDADLLPTPLADDWKGGTKTPHTRTGRPRTDQFRHWCTTVHGLTYPIPEHSEAVMGWPVGWTDLKPLATDKFREWQQQHGNS